MLVDSVLSELRLALSLHKTSEESFLKGEVGIDFRCFATAKVVSETTKSCRGYARICALGSSCKVGPGTGWLIVRDPYVDVVSVNFMSFRIRSICLR